MSSLQILSTECLQEEVEKSQHLGFLKLTIFIGRCTRGSRCITVPNFVKIGQTVLRYHDFLFYKMAATAILDFRNS